MNIIKNSTATLTKQGDLKAGQQSQIQSCYKGHRSSGSEDETETSTSFSGDVYPIVPSASVVAVMEKTATSKTRNHEEGVFEDVIIVDDLRLEEYGGRTVLTKDGKNISNKHRRFKACSNFDFEAVTATLRITKVMGIVSSLVGLYIIYDFCNDQNLLITFNAYVDMLQTKPSTAICIYMLGYAMGTFICLPNMVLQILALIAGSFFVNLSLGFAMTVLVASSATFLASVIGSVASFVAARSCCMQKKYDKVSSIPPKDTATSCIYYIKVLLEEDPYFYEDNRGFYVMALLRLSPAIPLCSINYIAGSKSAISFAHYFFSLSSLIIPITLYVTLGACSMFLIQSIIQAGKADSNTNLEIVVSSVTLMLTIEALVFTSYYTKKTLNYMITRTEDEKAVQNALRMSFVMESDDEFSMRKMFNGRKRTMVDDARLDLI